MYGPAHVVDAVNRIRGPFNVNAPAIAAGIAAIRDTAHVEHARAHNAQWLAWLTEEIGKLGLQVTPSVAQFRADPFPRAQGPHRQGGRRVPDQARADPAPGRRLQVAERAAHDASAPRRRTGWWSRRSPSSWEDPREQTGASVQPPGADRRRADRLLDRARRARAGRGALDRRHGALGGDAQARGRARPRRSGGGNQCRRGRRRRSGHRLHSGRRLRRGRQGDRPAS